jgi:putative tryptophan/tyrosine transport system substrate-binding protein
MMRRREFITLLGGATAWPLAARAQQRPKMLRVGTVQWSIRNRPTFGAFEQRLRELGYVEGQNLSIDYVRLEGREEVDRYAQAIKGMIQRGVDIFVAASDPCLKAAMSVTDSLPIVMVAVDFDPFSLGYVSSLARPTGNVTGLFLRQIELAVKRLELLKEAFPDRAAITVFWDQRATFQWQAVERAAPSLGIRVAGIELRDPPYDYERALNEAPADHRGTLLALSTPFLLADRLRLAEFALQRRVATFLDQRVYTDAGALMSYGVPVPGMWRRAAEFVDRIALGAKITDLPIEQPTKFEFIVNLKTAKAIGVELPTATLLRADEVME